MHYLDFKEVYACSFSDEIEPRPASGMSGSEFVAYCEANQETTSPGGRFYWDDEFEHWNFINYPVSYSAEDLVVWIQDTRTEGNSNFEFYDRIFNVELRKNGDVVETYNFIQLYKVYLFHDDDPRIGNYLFGTFSTDNGKEGATVNEVEYIVDIATLKTQNINGFSPAQMTAISCSHSDENLIIRHDNPLEMDSEDPCEAKFLIKYHVYDAVLVNAMGFGDDSKIAVVNETQTLHRKVHYSGTLRPRIYSGDMPPAVTDRELTVNYLENEGANIFSYCPDNELEVSYYEDERIREGEYLRTFEVGPSGCEDEDNVATYTQRWFYRAEDAETFFLTDIRDVSDEGAHDGGATITFPSSDIGCHNIIEPNILDKIKRSYRVEWHNKTTDETIVLNGDDPEVDDPFTVDNLGKGDYEVKVFAECPDCELQNNVPVFKAEFKIEEYETKLYIVLGVRLYAGRDNFLSGFGLHRYADDNLPEGEQYEGDRSLYSLNGSTFPYNPSGLTIDLYSQRHRYEWDVERGTFNFNPQEYVFPSGDDHQPFHEWVADYKQRYDRHFTVAKGVSGKMPRALIFKVYDDEGKLRNIKREPFYHEELKCPEDPNDIFGPAGYTNADSTIVRMINAKDDIDYTIHFENDPELATAAASRVKITCPLDEHADPTTFRLGNFGFGEYTFEVPPLASYYNNRINMDSLGYWLDVTASVQVPENEAYWIFQTIDPATGVAPIDSLGFLPVNDTLLGNGEGFVTFTVSPRPGNNRSQISTGDTIVEQAQIYFDENEVVPTNRYKNVFDAVAPTSIIVCDTTGAKESMHLTIGFNAYDDEFGSGVRYIELYANVDLKGYTMIAQIEPDSTLHYPLVNGTNFEFMGLAVDNVGNKEPYKTYHELFYCLGNPPYDLNLSNVEFQENDVIGTYIGSFTTFDDQNTDNFVYALVDGPGSDDNSLFSIVGKELKTNYDFRCYGEYQYSIRVRTTDITNAYLEKTFTLFANQTEIIEPKLDYIYLCPGEGFYLHGEYITEPGTYLDTLSSQHGCDSVVRRIVRMNSAPVTTYADDAICFGYDYTENGFNIPADSLAALTQGWDMQDEITLNLDNYVENAFHCYDTTRLTLTVRPAYDFVDEVLVCPTDLPYNYHGRLFYSDTTYMLRYSTPMGCDSTYTLQMTINPESGTQSDNLANGWNWYSTYIDQSNGRGLANLEAALGTHGRTIKSKTQFVQYSPELNAWFGNLNGIDGLSMYQIETDAAYMPSVFGCFGSPDTITLHNGWTWIGYPMPEQMYVSQTPTAIVGYPSDGDIFKAKSSFAMYYADYGMWFGTLSVLEPGQGYMYNSSSSNDKYLYYPNHSRTEGHMQEVPEAHWVNNLHEFADNITILGLIELDGQAIESDSLEVGVFCNNEERGSGRAIYLEGLDAYRIFLTVQGEDGDELSFRLFDHNRDKERRIRCRQQLTFHADDHYGDLRSPYVIRFATDYDKLIEAEICEGQYYTDNGFRAFRQGTYFKELTGQHGNDSIVRLDLTVNPVYQYEEEVVAVEFPFPYGDLTFDRPGTYNLPFVTEHGCDSLVVLKVVPYEGVRELLISPVPANRSDRVTLYFPFTRAEQQGLQVEVYTLAGSLMQYDTPTRFPIELKPFEVAGTYMVKVTMGTGEVVTGKIIVK